MTREGSPVHASSVPEDRVEWPRELSPRGVDVWYCTGSHHPALEESSVLNRLTVEQRSQADRLAGTKNRRSFLAARLLLQGVLAGYCECEPSSLEYSTGAFGKPFLSSPCPAVNAGLQFNLSRSAEVVAVAVGYMPLGLDIEKQRPLTRERAFLARQFSPAEQEYVRCSPDPQSSLFEIWCRKEAYLKALGLGIFHPLKKCPVAPGCTLPGLEPLIGQPRLDWDIRSLALPLPDYAAALCSPAPVPSPRVIPLTCAELLEATP